MTEKDKEKLAQLKSQLAEILTAQAHDVRVNVDPFSEEYYSVKEIAELMKVSRFVVNRLIEKGELESERFGRSYRISKTALVKYLNRDKGAKYD